MRKLIFLDIDGVLNSHQWWHERPKIPSDVLMRNPSVDEDHNLDPVNMERLNRLVRETGAQVVISSTWRITRSLLQLREVLHRNGFIGQIVGTTPRIHSKTKGGIYMATIRGHEIQKWLETHCQHQELSFVILDDDVDADPFRDRLVRTDLRTGGLQDHHVEAAIQKLAEKWGGRVTKD
jgi:hypothetical protein